MIKLKLKYLTCLLIVGGIVYSCQKKEEYPVIPEIKFESLLKIFNPATMVYDRGVFKISFKDGDGDIGLNESDILPPYDYNFFISYYELQNGDSIRVIIADSNEFNARIPVLTPDGANKSIKGEIEDTLFIYNYQSEFDTIKFDAYILDRALHQSNVVTTGWFIRN
jgi:hypothetical protein